jgi:hypothetical protein
MPPDLASHKSHIVGIHRESNNGHCHSYSIYYWLSTTNLTEHLSWPYAIWFISTQTKRWRLIILHYVTVQPKPNTSHMLPGSSPKPYKPCPRLNLDRLRVQMWMPSTLPGARIEPPIQALQSITWADLWVSKIYRFKKIIASLKIIWISKTWTENLQNLDKNTWGKNEICNSNLMSTNPVSNYNICTTLNVPPN